MAAKFRFLESRWQKVASMFSVSNFPRSQVVENKRFPRTAKKLQWNFRNAILPQGYNMRKMKTDSDIVEHLAIDKKPLQTKQEEPTITEVKLVPKPIVKNSCKFKREGWKTPCGSVYIELEYKGKRLLSVRCFPYRHVYPRENLSKAS